MKVDCELSIRMGAEIVALKFCSVAACVLATIEARTGAEFAHGKISPSWMFAGLASLTMSEAHISTTDAPVGRSGRAHAVPPAWSEYWPLRYSLTHAWVLSDIRKSVEPESHV